MCQKVFRWFFVKYIYRLIVDQRCIRKILKQGEVFQMKERNYWGYRIDTRAIDFFASELDEKRLRQGWGWDERQDLSNMVMDEGARRNRLMYDRVKKGDILLIPRLPLWDCVTIAEAIEDWDKGYKFEISKGQIDYGHIFPAKKLRTFVRDSSVVKGKIRSTLKCYSRFWGVNHCANEITEILESDESECGTSQGLENRLESIISTSFIDNFMEQKFKEHLYERLNQHLNGEEWEYALVHGLRYLFPYYEIEHVGGPREIHHGTDILIKLPAPFFETRYAIAIQVKDYSGFVSRDVIEQINKADLYWAAEGLTLIDKIVIVTNAERAQNVHLLENIDGVHFCFIAELENLLLAIGKSFVKVSDVLG